MARSKIIDPIRSCPTCLQLFTARRQTSKYCSPRCRDTYPEKNRPRIPVEERFWRYVDKKAVTECWPWNGTKAKGYGILGLCGKERTYIYAHRLSYQMHVGPIGSGLLVLHRCDYPACVNPAHLFLGTQLDNAQDMRNKRRGHWQRWPIRITIVVFNRRLQRC